MQKSKSKSNENDVKSAKLPRSIQKSDNILGNTCKSYSFTHSIEYLLLHFVLNLRIFIFKAQIRRWVFVSFVKWVDVKLAHGSVGQPNQNRLRSRMDL